MKKACMQKSNPSKPGEDFSNTNSVALNVDDNEELRKKIINQEKDIEFLKSKLLMLEKILLSRPEGSDFKKIQKAEQMKLAKHTSMELEEVEEESESKSDSGEPMLVKDEEYSNKRNKKRASYTMKYKQKIILLYDELKSCRKVSLKTGVPRTCVHDWVKQRNEISQSLVSKQSKRQRLPGGGRKPYDEEIEEFLFNWITEQRKKNLQVSFKRLLIFARATFKDSKLTFSYGWLRKFMKRKNFSYRKRTKNNYVDPNKITKGISEFFSSLYDYMILNKHKELLFNMDETRITLDMISNQTIDFKGKKSIPIETTNGERIAYTICLCGFSNGAKLPPFIIFSGHGKILGNKLSSQNVVFTFSGEKKSFMNASAFRFWWENVWMKHTDSSTRKKTLVLLDSCGSLHRTYKPEDTDVMFFPPNTTSELQPMDLGINHPFKQSIRLEWEKWISEDVNTIRTLSGSRKVVDRNTFINWVENAWAAISEDSMRNSFKKLFQGLEEIKLKSL